MQTFLNLKIVWKRANKFHILFVLFNTGMPLSNMLCHKVKEKKMLSVNCTCTTKNSDLNWNKKAKTKQLRSETHILFLFSYFKPKTEVVKFLFYSFAFKKTKCSQAEVISPMWSFPLSGKTNDICVNRKRKQLTLYTYQ